MPGKSDPDTFVSIVGILDATENCIESFLRAVAEILKQTYSDYEIVLLDNCSTDNSASVVENLLREIPSIRMIRLSSRVTNDIAFAAGLENAIGDVVILMQPGIDPPDCIRPLVRQCHAGDDVIVGTSKNAPFSWGYRCLQRYGLAVLKYLLAYDSPKNATHLRCLSRRAANAVLHSGAFHHRLSVRIYRTGYRMGTFEYMLKGDRRPERRTIFSGLYQGLQMLVFNSTTPLRLINGLGLLASFLALLFGVYSILIRLLKERVVEGWATLVVMNSSMFFLLFIVLAFFGEYLRRLLEEQSNQARYNVLYEKNSSVMINENRLNVLEDSTDSNPSAVQTGRDR